MERVHVAVGVDRAGRGDERLAGDLAAEDPLHVDLGARPPEDVDLDRLEVEQGDQLVDGVLLHGRHPGTPPAASGRSAEAGGPTVRRHARRLRLARFPDGFTWGTATAAHQIEGGNWNNDWWGLEHTPGSGRKEPSGDACDSWHRWAEDADLVRDLGLGNYRFSLEWSRIEPEDGEWSTAALDHYARHVRRAAASAASTRS